MISTEAHSDPEQFTFPSVNPDMSALEQHKAEVEAFGFADVDSPIKVIEKYNENAGCYDYILTECMGYRDSEYVVKALRELTSIPTNSKFIDFACGTGLVGEWLQREGFQHIVGIDASKEMLDSCKKKEIYS